MKKIVISTLAVLCAAPAFARGVGESSWQLFGLDPYIGIRGGFSYDNLNYSFNGDDKSLSDWLWQGRAAMGLQFCNRVRSEIEWSIFSKAKDSDNFNGLNAKVDMKMQTLLWNTFMEFGDWRVVRPFAGIGAGVAFPNISRTVEGVHDKSFAEMRFSAMGSLGVSFDMEYFAVDLSARYNYIDVASGLHNIGADLGIRFMF